MTSLGGGVMTCWGSAVTWSGCMSRQRRHCWRHIVAAYPTLGVQSPEGMFISNIVALIADRSGSINL